jgi:hypothetical protein
MCAYRSGDVDTIGQRRQVTGGIADQALRTLHLLAGRSRSRDLPSPIH